MTTTTTCLQQCDNTEDQQILAHYSVVLEKLRDIKIEEENKLQCTIITEKSGIQVIIIS